MFTKNYRIVIRLSPLEGRKRPELILLPALFYHKYNSASTVSLWWSFSRLCLNTWNQCSADDDVYFFTLLGKKIHLSLNELLRHLFGVTSDPLSRLFDVNF